jgi:Zn finger protein HypA/HybF involved in hydrogenase expression
MGGWIAAKVRCNVCTGTHVSVHPEEAPEDRLECPSCGGQDSEIVEYAKKAIDTSKIFIPDGL